MSTNDFPCLCGGTFFTLVLQALRQRMSAREHYSGDSDGLSDAEVLVGLIKVIHPDYADPGKEKLKTIANNYKRCETSTSVYFPFDDNLIVSAFDKSVRTDYQTPLNEMIAFVNRFLDMSEGIHKDAYLVRALVDLILQDQSIGGGDEFYIGSDGGKMKKAALGGLKEVCFPSFLLGIWHYVVVYRKDNGIGKKTYDTWCPSTGGGQRKYTAHMGEGILDGLSTYRIEQTDRIHTDIAGDPTDDKTAGTVDDGETTVNQQMVNNNPAFFNIKILGGNNSFYHHVENLTINNGGKQDE